MEGFGNSLLIGPAIVATHARVLTSISAWHTVQVSDSTMDLPTDRKPVLERLAVLHSNRSRPAGRVLQHLDRIRAIRQHDFAACMMGNVSNASPVNCTDQAETQA